MSQTKVRRGKKRWYPILAPKLFESKKIGETVVYEVEELEGRQLSINLMHLTGNSKRQNMQMFFRVTDVIDGKAQTKPLGIEMQHSSIKRLVRRGRTKIADSFLAKTKKDQYVRIKPIIVTRYRVDNEVQTAVRLKARELIRESTRKYSFDTVLNDIVQMKLQRHLKDQLSSITPIRSADIRFLKYEQQVDNTEEELEESLYEERPQKPRAVKKAPASGLESLKQEVEGAMFGDDDDEDEDDE